MTLLGIFAIMMLPMVGLGITLALSQMAVENKL